MISQLRLKDTVSRLCLLWTPYSVVQCQKCDVAQLATAMKCMYIRY